MTSGSKPARQVASRVGPRGGGGGGGDCDGDGGGFAFAAFDTRGTVDFNAVFVVMAQLYPRMGVRSVDVCPSVNKKSGVSTASIFIRR